MIFMIFMITLIILSTRIITKITVQTLSQKRPENGALFTVETGQPCIEKRRAPSLPTNQNYSLINL
jgi:hypothetical protein